MANISSKLFSKKITCHEIHWISAIEINTLIKFLKQNDDLKTMSVIII